MNSAATKGYCLSLGLLHAVVDAATAGALLGALALHRSSPETRYALIFTYNAIAFGSQPLWGLIVDRFGRPFALAAVGLILPIAGLPLVAINPIAAVILVSLGNALFHVGAGVLALTATPFRALGPGLFVAPGAVGLGVGSYLGKNGGFRSWPFGLLLAGGLGLLYWLEKRSHYTAGQPNEPVVMPTFRLPYLALALFMVSIFARSLIGSTFKYGLAAGLPTLAALSLAAAGGKACGGALSDRFGWFRISVGALLLSLPLLAFHDGRLAAAAAGLLLFQTTMPVTLVAVVAIMPKRPGLAFGLNCLALFAGSLIDASQWKYVFFSPLAQSAAILLAALVVGLGLGLRRAGVSAVQQGLYYQPKAE